jgi:hypothetical protein
MTYIQCRLTPTKTLYTKTKAEWERKLRREVVIGWIPEDAAKKGTLVKMLLRDAQTWKPISCKVMRPYPSYRMQDSYAKEYEPWILEGKLEDDAI